MTMLAQLAVMGGAPPVYIEDVFSTWLYTGTGATQTITNGIDLAGKGGLVWIKNRSDVKNNILADSARGPTNWLSSNLTNAQATDATKVSSFSASGFSVGSDSTVNLSTQNYASWTFRKQPKFFDVVTYTGNGASNRAISHSLGSTPGCVIVKRVSAAENWIVWHRSISAANKMLVLNSTAAQTGSLIAFDNSLFTSTTFGVNNDTSSNNNGDTYVAYLFAHNAGGFGLTGTDNVISCGSYTTDGSGKATVDLGYEPQWTLHKKTNAAQNWLLFDVMRGMPNGADTSYLAPNSSTAEYTGGASRCWPTSTGFQVEGFGASQTFIYIAIRRGPMKVPTTGTSVFSPNATTATSGTLITTNFPVDLQITKRRDSSGNNFALDRLRGVSTTATESGQYLVTNATDAETSSSTITRAWGNTGFQISSDFNGQSQIYWNFRRAPGFFDEVCYTGTGSATTVAHNLAAVPELIICKSRSAGDDWPVFAGPLGNPASVSTTLRLNTTQAVASSAFWNNTAPTASVFTLPVGGYGNNNSGENYVSYLFASCPGVSKVGVYTGTGATLTVNCGFTGGARFVMIKRTDSTGEWYVWDTARGMVSGTDPFLRLNSTAAEVNADTVFTVTGGFQVVSTGTGLNASGGTYIFLAIA